MVVPSIILVGYTVGQTGGHTVDHTCVVLLRRIVSRLVGRSIMSVEWPLSDTIVRPLLYVGR